MLLKDHFLSIGSQKNKIKIHLQIATSNLVNNLKCTYVIKLIQYDTKSKSNGAMSNLS